MKRRNPIATQVTSSATPAIEEQRWPRRCRVATLVAVLAGLMSGAVVQAADAAPVLDVRPIHFPTNLPPGGQGTYDIAVFNIGDEPADDMVCLGAPPCPITARVTVPEGQTIAEAGDRFGGLIWVCDIDPDGNAATCTYDPSNFLGPIPPGHQPCVVDFPFGTCPILVTVDVAADAQPGVATVEACGGNVPACDSAEDHVVVSGEPAGFGVQRFDWEVRDKDGSPSTQAGAHPWAMSITLQMNSIATDINPRRPADNLKNMTFRLPEGVIGDPTATPLRCTRDQIGQQFEGSGCPLSSQVGTVAVKASLYDRERFPLFNMEPAPGVAAQLGVNVEDVGIVIASARVSPEGGHAVTITANGLPETDPLHDLHFELWGVPADPSHDVQRGICAINGGTCPVDAPLKPFLSNPTDCLGPYTATVTLEPWQVGGSDSATVNAYPDGLQGCERLRVEPQVSVQPTNPKAGEPSGYLFDLQLAQHNGANGLVPSHIKEVGLALPEGVSVSPSGAHGLEACSPSQIALGSAAEPTCPGGSTVGSVEIDTPVLEEPVTGDVYLATPRNNPFGSLLAIYIVAQAPGVMVKLAGDVRADPVTGQLTTTFRDNPQLPFSRFRLSLKGGPTAALANPIACGQKTVTAAVSPWSGSVPTPAGDSFAIDCPGVLGFAPALDAGTTNAIGGAFSPFALRINRQDTDQYLRGLSMEMPPGLTGKLKDIPLCSDAQAASGTCPIESRVGRVTVGAGPGPNPFFVRGGVFLTGPYKDAPFGLAVAVRAVAGPFDLGTVVVRQELFVDRVDAHITVVSDPFPTILEGIPLRVRSINVDIDRPGFTLNPTSCAPKQIRATLVSTEGVQRQVAQHFQVAGCRALPLRPRLALRLTGRRQTTDGKHPGVRAVLRQGRGQANLRRVAVKLPLSLALDPERAQSDDLCEFEAGQRVDCPASSIIGRARAFTPLLNRPLEGPVHFVKNVRLDRRTGRQIRTLPTLLIPLRGEVAIDLRARTTARRGKLVSVFPTIPDAPVSRFELTLRGGRRGILVVTGDRDICSGRQIADVEIDGQNGKRADRAVRLRTPCPKKRAARPRLSKQAGAATG
jgi:hypothetical protein